MAKYLLLIRQVGDISGATNGEVGSRRDTQVRTCLFLLLPLQLTLASHWTEVVTYFRGTFCIENWFLGVVTEAAVISGFFFSDSYHPFPSSWPMHGDFNKM